MLIREIERLLGQYRLTPVRILDVRQFTAETLLSVVGFTRTDDGRYHVFGKPNRDRVYSYHPDSRAQQVRMLEGSIFGQLTTNGLDLFLTDITDGMVKRWKPDGEMNVIGSGLDYPYAIAMGKGRPGGIYVTEYFANTVALIRDGEVVSRLRDEVLKNPSGVAISNDGMLYVVNGGRGQIVKFDADGNVVKIYGRTGCNDDEFNIPHSVAVADDGRIVVTDAYNRCVKVLQANGKHRFSVYGLLGEEMVCPQGLVARGGRYAVCCAHSMKIFEFEI